MKLPAINYPDTPDGIRAVRINVWGNVVGYVSGRRFWEFGKSGMSNELTAEAWKASGSLREAYET